MKAQSAPYLATYSLAARDPRSGALGVAVASKFLAVGALVPFVRAGVGAVATQARTNLAYGPAVLDLLEDGGRPDEAVRAVRSADESAQYRQLGVVAADGRSAGATGSGCREWAGNVCGPDFAIQGNILAGPQVLEAMTAAWEHAAGLGFPQKLLAVLRAGEEHGGDARGKQSAALLVVLPDGTKTDLRVDDHREPVAELGRLLSLCEAGGQR